LVPPVDVPSILESVLLKTIAKKPEKRYQSMNDLKQDLMAVREGKTPSIVYNQMRDTSLSTIPPSPAEVVGAERKTVASIDDEIPAQRSRLPLFAGIAAVVIVAIIAGIFLLKNGSDNERKSQTGKSAIAKPMAETAVEQNTAKPEPAAAEKQETSAIKVTSEPKNASIYKNGALIGKLPIDLNRPGKGIPDTHYQLRLAGYESQDIIITEQTPEKFQVTLRKLAKAPSEDSQPKKSSSRRKKKKRRSKSSRGDLADPWAQ
jgi:hypothetical protein